MLKKNTLFDYINMALLLIIALITVIPIVHVAMSSIAGIKQVSGYGLVLWPEELNFDAYKYVFSSPAVFNSLWVSVRTVLFGTIAKMTTSLMFAYSLSRKQFKARYFLMNLVIIPMFFKGGLIPTFLVLDTLSLINTFYALILPSMIVSMQIILMKNFFSSLPEELEESAKIEGANDFRIFAQIMIPLSKPMIATFTLFSVVEFWNSYMPALFFTSSRSLWPLQLILRNIVMLSQGSIEGTSASALQMSPEHLKMSVIMVSMIPMLMIYPFMQKYFAGGILLGSVKG